MTEQQVLKLLRLIRGAYPRVTFDDDTINVYTGMLHDLPYGLAQTAVAKLIRTSQWPPTIAEIRRACAEMAFPLPTTDEAEAEVRACAQAFSPYGPPLAWQTPLVKRAVAAIGGIEAIAFSEQPGHVYRDFRRVYEQLRERELLRLQTQPGAIAEAAKLSTERHLSALPGGAALPEGVAS